MIIKKEKEYDFKYTKEYGQAVDKIIEILKEEYPVTIKKIEDNKLGFEVTSLVIHAINYARQIY